MGQKVNPKSLRLLITKDWESRWITKNLFAYNVLADDITRKAIYKKFENIGINRIVIERSPQETKITIETSRPGTIIGRNGKGIEELKNIIKNAINSSSNFRLINSTVPINTINDIKKKLIHNIKINITEIRDSETYAKLVGQDIANQLIKRMPYRRVVKKTISKVTSSKQVMGVKISVAGRLGGVDIARSEKFSEGSIPLATIKTNVDYAYVPALTTHGIIGIKVWIYKKDK